MNKPFSGVISDIREILLSPVDGTIWALNDSVLQQRATVVGSLIYGELFNKYSIRNSIYNISQVNSKSASLREMRETIGKPMYK